MLLNEYYGNLEMIDKSLFKHLKDKVGTRLAPTTEIKHDLLKKDEETGTVRKTWKYVTDVILSDSKVLGIIIRSNHRQLMMVVKNTRDTSYTTYWSDIGQTLQFYKDNINMPNGKYSSNLTVVRHDISKTVEGFIIEHPNARKNWDIIIISNDKTDLDYKKSTRSDRKIGIVPRPDDKVNYNSYIQKLHNQLQERLLAYSESKLQNLQTREDLINLIKSNPKSLVMNKFKLLNGIWTILDVKTSNPNNEVYIVVTYQLNYNNRNYKSIPTYELFNGMPYLMVKYRVEGIGGLTIESIGFGRSSYTASISMGFDEMAEFVLNKVKSIDEEESSN